MPSGVVPVPASSLGLLVGPLRLDLGQFDGLHGHVPGPEGMRIDEACDHSARQRTRPVHLPDTHTHTYTYTRTGRGTDRLDGVPVT